MDINILISCTNKKRLPTPGPLDLSTVPRDNRPVRLKQWTTRLKETKADLMKASQLYMGNAWAVARSLPQAASDKGLDAKLWVCSAGYGLIRLDTQIKPYNATFGTGQPESISRKTQRHSLSEDRQAWWAGLATWPGPERGQPRTISSLVDTYKDTPLVVAASPHYIDAMERDLSRAVQNFSDRDLLMIISTGTKRLELLSSRHLMPTHGCLRMKVGGSMHELNVRLVRHLFERSNADSFRASKVHSRLIRWMQDLELTQYNRTPITDDEAKLFIQRKLDQYPNARPTRLLRALRDSGRACEQRRFKILFDQVEQYNGLYSA